MTEFNEEIFYRFKMECRKIALSSAERLNPSDYSYNTQLGGSQKTKASLTQVLSDADKIYEWLIRGV